MMLRHVNVQISHLHVHDICQFWEFSVDFNGLSLQQAILSLDTEQARIL